MIPCTRTTQFLALICASALAAATVFAEENAEDNGWDVNDIPGEARSIEIDVTSGTWMSLDVSPDGQTITFDMLGDIYLLPIGGGEARNIRSGLEWSMQPRFSPGWI